MSNTIPKTMKACMYHTYGSPEVLHIEDVATPKPNTDEVLVKIHASSINSWDWDMLSGKPLLYRLIHGVRKPKFPVLGGDVSGEIVAIGSDVTSLKVGDKVYGDVTEIWGAFAEYGTFPAKRLQRIPEGLDIQTAATIPHSAVMAYQTLIDVRPTKAGDHILINAAGGCVGTFVVQMAKHMGATVTCVDSGEKLSMLKDLGADYVIDYKKQDFTQNGKKYDRIIDMISQRSVFAYRKSLVKDGISAVLGGKVGCIIQNGILGPIVSKWNTKKSIVSILRQNNNLELIEKLITDGIVKPHIGGVFPLKKVSEAMQLIGDGKSNGKLVISISN